MNPVIHFIWIWGSWLCLAVACVLAFWRGGPPERWGAAILLIAWLVTPLVDNHHGFRAGVFLVDFATLLAFSVLSGRTRRLWALLATGFEFVDIATHIAVLLGLGVGSWSYITGIQIFGGYGPVFALVWGALTARDKRERQSLYN